MKKRTRNLMIATLVAIVATIGIVAVINFRFLPAPIWAGAVLTNLVALAMLATCPTED